VGGTPTVLAAMAFPHLAAAYQAANILFPLFTMLYQNTLISQHFLTHLSFYFPGNTLEINLKVGNKVGFPTLRLMNKIRAAKRTCSHEAL
jgi:hypothetical protein